MLWEKELGVISCGFLLPVWAGSIVHVPRPPCGMRSQIRVCFGLLISVDIEADPIPGSGGVEGELQLPGKGNSSKFAFD